MRGLRGRTLSPGGIENRLKSLPKTRVHELSDSEMLTFLRELSESKRHAAITEFDMLARQGLVDEAASLDLIAERLTDIISGNNHSH